MDYVEQNHDIMRTDTLNEIVARYPETLPVLNRFALDTCCGGALTLQTAAEHHALSIADVLAALRAARAKGALA